MNYNTARWYKKELPGETMASGSSMSKAAMLPFKERESVCVCGSGWVGEWMRERNKEIKKRKAHTDKYKK